MIQLSLAQAKVEGVGIQYTVFRIISIMLNRDRMYFEFVIYKEEYLRI